MIPFESVMLFAVAKAAAAVSLANDPKKALRNEANNAAVLVAELDAIEADPLAELAALVAILASEVAMPACVVAMDAESAAEIA